MKKLLIGVGALVVLVVGILVYVLLNVDAIVETAVNDYGPGITQTEVVLDSADIGLFSGSGALNGLRIGNPVNRGFKPRDLMAVDGISVRLDRDSLLEDTIIIHEIVIQRPKIAYESQGKTDNFEALLMNIEESTGGGSAQESDQAQADQGKPGKKIIIENVYIREGEITADLTGLPGEGLTMALPEVHVADIGKEEQGATPADAMAAIVEGLYGGMELAFQESGDMLMQGGEWAVDQAGGAVEGAGDVVDDAADSLKGLF